MLGLSSWNIDLRFLGEVLEDENVAALARDIRSARTVVIWDGETVKARGSGLSFKRDGKDMRACRGVPFATPWLGVWAGAGARCALSWRLFAARKSSKNWGDCMGSAGTGGWV